MRPKIPLPPINVDDRGIPCIKWVRNDARIMDIVREVLSLADLNAPWLPYRYTRDDYYELIASTASIRLRYIDEVRNTYMMAGNTGRNRTYSRIVIPPSTVASIVSWIESSLGIKLYYGIGGQEIDIRVENVPICPGCGRRLQLFWKLRNSSYTLCWGCAIYGNECRNTMMRIWQGRLPNLVADPNVLPTYFHDWELDGHPIPRKYISEPLTEWSLVRGGPVQTILNPMEVNMVRGQKNTGFTEEQKAYIMEHYSTDGAAGFMRHYPRVWTSYYEVQRMAHKLGVSKKISRKSKATKPKVRKSSAKTRTPRV